MTTPTTATPIGQRRQRRQRIADLERLRDRIDAELEQERRALARIMAPLRRRVDRAVVPSTIDSRHVRAWARAHGWPDLGQRGRIPAIAIDAYLDAHPGAHR